MPKTKQKAKQEEDRVKLEKKLNNQIKECNWRIYKIDSELYDGYTEVNIDNILHRTRKFRVDGKRRKELLSQRKDEVEKRKALQQELHKLRRSNKKRTADKKTSVYTTIKERRFNIRTSNNENPYASTIYRDVSKEKNITTKSSVWPVGWPKKK